MKLKMPSLYAKRLLGVGVTLKVTAPGELERAIEKALLLERPIITDIDVEPKRFI